MDNPGNIGCNAAAVPAVMPSPRSFVMVSTQQSSASGSTGGRASLGSGQALIPTLLTEGFSSVIPLHQAAFGDAEPPSAEERLSERRASMGMRGASAQEVRSFSLYTREPSVSLLPTRPIPAGGGRGGQGFGSRVTEPIAVRHDILLKLMAEPSDEVGQSLSTGLIHVCRLVGMYDDAVVGMYDDAVVGMSS